MKFKDFSDPELYMHCKTTGIKTRHTQRKFAGALPEVFKRGLHRRRGFGSIHEFAAKMGNMSHGTVDKILRLAEKFKDTPKLLNLLETGECGWSKLEIIATIITPENDIFWADKATNLSQRALKTYIQELKKEEIRQIEMEQMEVEKMKILCNKKNLKNSLCLESNPSVTYNKKGTSKISVDGKYNTPEKQTEGKWQHFSFPISPELHFKLHLLKHQMEKAARKTLTFNEILLRLLEEK